MPHGVNEGIHTIHRDIDVVNFYDENENVLMIQKVLICLVIETFVIEFWVVSPSYNSIHQGLRHGNCMMFKVTLIKN